MLPQPSDSFFTGDYMECFGLGHASSPQTNATPVTSFPFLVHQNSPHYHLSQGDSSGQVKFFTSRIQHSACAVHQELQVEISSRMTTQYKLQQDEYEEGVVPDKGSLHSQLFTEELKTLRSSLTSSVKETFDQQNALRDKGSLHSQLFTKELTTLRSSLTSSVKDTFDEQNALRDNGNS